MDRLQFEEALKLTNDVEVEDFPLNSNCRFTKEGDTVLFNTGEGEFSLDNGAYTRAAAGVGISKAYVGKTPAELILPHLDYWFRHREGSLRMVRKGRDILHFIPSTIEPVSNRVVIDAAIEVMGKDVEFDKVHCDIDYTLFSILGPKSETVREGDILNAGVQIQNSLTGRHPLEVVGYINRLVCSNGLVAPKTVVRWSRRGNNVSEVRDWVRAAVGDAYSKVDEEFVRIKGLQGMSIKGVSAEVLNTLFKTYGISAKLGQEIMSKLIEDGGSTLYDVLNAITFVASHSDSVQDVYASRRLMAVGGDLAENKRLCDKCHSLISG